MDPGAVRSAGGAQPKSAGRPVRERPPGASQGRQAQALIPLDIESDVREWLSLVTMHFGVQWSEVWGIPVWLWMQYVGASKAILRQQQKEARNVQ